MMADVTKARLALTRDQILAHRRQVGALDERLEPGAASLRRAAWAGLQDSVPRAALHSINARVKGKRPPAAARLLPSGDAYTLFQGADRALLVPSEVNRKALWTPRVRSFAASRVGRGPQSTPVRPESGGGLAESG